MNQKTAGSGYEYGALYRSEEKIYPREAKGRFATLRRLAMFVLLGAFYFGPWLTWDTFPSNDPLLDTSVPPDGIADFVGDGATAHPPRITEHLELMPQGTDAIGPIPLTLGLVLRVDARPCRQILDQRLGNRVVAVLHAELHDLGQRATRPVEHQRRRLR